VGRGLFKGRFLKIEESADGMRVYYVGVGVGGGLFACGRVKYSDSLKYGPEAANIRKALFGCDWLSGQVAGKE